MSTPLLGLGTSLIMPLRQRVNALRPCWLNFPYPCILVLCRSEFDANRYQKLNSFDQRFISCDKQCAVLLVRLYELTLNRATGMQSRKESRRNLGMVGSNIFSGWLAKGALT